MTAGKLDGAAASLRVRLTGILMARQFLLLLAVATLLFAQFFFFNLLDAVNFDDLMQTKVLLREWLTVPLLVLAVYGGVLIVGLAFAAGPSEHSFHVFFLIMLGGFGVANYDQSILEWVFRFALRTDFVVPNPVSNFKIILACGMFTAVILMHYNILADDFTRRMLGRGVAAEEVLPVRAHMVKLLLPVLFTAGAVAAGLGLVGEFSQLIFQNRGLFPKFEIVILGGLGVAIGVLLLNILRDYYGRRRRETNH